MTVPDLLGRSAQLSVLNELVTRLPERGGALVVLGEPGIGKSSLLRATAEYARDAGWRLLATTGVETETRLPFAGLHQLLRPVLSTTDGLPAGQRRALLSAFGVGTGPPPDPFMIALGALALITAAATQRPTVLIVDDLQWLDEPTRNALAFITRRLDDHPVLLVGAARKGQSRPLPAADLPEMDLPTLDDASARQLLSETAGGLGPIERERILHASAGNPLALVELPAAWRAAAEPAVEPAPAAMPLTARQERAFAGRLAELAPATRDAMLVAAVGTVDDLPEILAAVAWMTGHTAEPDVLDSAVAAGLLWSDEVRVSFRHPLIRSAVLQTETSSRRRAANAAVAAVLEKEPFRRAWHRAQSIVGPDDEVADELAVSHVVSLRRGSITSAIWALERSAQLAADSATRGRRLLLAAEHAFGLGRGDVVDRLLDAASRTALSMVDQVRLQWLLEIFNDGVPLETRRVLELCDAAAQAADAEDPGLALNLLLAAAQHCWWADAGPAARAQVVEEIGRLPGAQDDPRYVATLALAEPVGQATAVVDTLSRVVPVTVDDPDTLRMLGMAAHALGDPVRSVDLLDRAETKLREQGRLGLLAQVLTMQILDRLELGDWNRAAALADEGRRLAQDTGQPIWDTGALLLGATVVGLRGDNDRAQSLATRAEHAANGRRLADLLACVQLARGLGWISTGNHTEAYAALCRLFDPAEPCFHLTERFHGVTFLAEAAVRAGRRDDARAVLAELETVAVTTSSPTLHVHLAYARAVLADDEQAERLYLAALSGDLVRWPWAKARLELAYGGWLRRQRRVAESREPLRSALTAFELIEAGFWAEQARGELRAAGDHAESETPALDTLSAQERQIARLAARGLSNREIGQRLFLSPRTVGSHLYRIFPKLKVTSRGQLAAHLDGR
jgi:DNA-binding CsgD family transcriptional regulator